MHLPKQQLPRRPYIGRTDGRGACPAKPCPEQASTGMEASWALPARPAQQSAWLVPTLVLGWKLRDRPSSNARVGMLNHFTQGAWNANQAVVR